MARDWRYTLDAPPANWVEPEFADRDWKLGRAAFGRKEGWESAIQTPWSTKDIWLRQSFVCDKVVFERAMLVIHYDNGTEVYVNGKQVWKGEGWNDAYAGFDVTKPLRGALHAGRNEIAIHCHQDEGGQYIDAALLAGDK
jgi:beta-galactosidase